ncbi:hypothetical protein L1987_32496 [Smallanthus sonchifolius]|uniref:Uncharacterized protein n=1 Tax=Smallanthus sonchifolius TaxID=185202 RepID=A0ACB9HP31_9ASTR|nr:hypothetical protein L1987_32496 [Smallanthus sonchifolius]
MVLRKGIFVSLGDHNPLHQKGKGFTAGRGKRRGYPHIHQTPREEAGQDSPATNGPSVELLQNNTALQTPSPFRITSASSRTDTLLLMEMMDVTPEGVQKNFLGLREPMNSYVQEERAKGVKVRLAYEDEPEVTFSPIPPPPFCINVVHEEEAVTSGPNQNKTHVT